MVGDMPDPEPGRPGTLGPKADAADARSIVAVARASRRAIARGSPRAGPKHLVREGIWSWWEAPRLPEALQRKYPKSYPWSAGAQERFREKGPHRPVGGWGLVIEHLYPRGMLVQDLLDDGDLDAERAAALLTARLMAAVVTEWENKQLPPRGQAGDTWDDYAADPWRRYRASPLDLSRFGPLQE
jgi:hypothetical protein